MLLCFNRIEEVLMDIYVASKQGKDGIEMLKAFNSYESAIDYLNILGQLYRDDDIEFFIEPISLEE